MDINDNFIHIKVNSRNSVDCSYCFFFYIESIILNVNNFNLVGLIKLSDDKKFITFL